MGARTTSDEAIAPLRPSLALRMASCQFEKVTQFTVHIVTQKEH